MLSRTSLLLVFISSLLFVPTVASAQLLDHVVWVKADSGRYQEAVAMAMEVAASDSTQIEVLCQGVRAALCTPQSDQYIRDALADRSSTLVSRMRRTIVLEETGRLQQALALADSLRTRYAVCGVAVRYAALLVQMDRLDEAEKTLLSLRDSSACRTQTLKELARLYQARGNFDAADSLWGELEELGTSPFTGASGVALNLIRRGFYHDALDSLRLLCTKFSTAHSYYSLAWALNLLEAPEEAWPILQEALSRWPNNMRLIAEAIGTGSRLGYTDAVDTLLSRLTLPQRAYLGVTAVAERARALDDTLSFQSEVEGLLNACDWREWVVTEYLQNLRDRGRGAEADRWLDSLSCHASILDQAYVRVSLALRQSPAAALDTLAPYLQRCPDSPFLLSQKARYLYLAGEVEQGRRLIDSMLAEEPGNWYLLTSAFWLESHARHHEEAAVRLDRLMKKAYVPTAVLERRLQFLYDKENLPEAERLLDSARMAAPGNPELMWYSSVLYGDEDKASKLRTTAKEFLASGRLPYIYLTTLVALLRQAEQSAVAESLCTAYLARYPNAAALYHERGLCHYAVGNYEAAADDMARAKELNPYNQAYDRGSTTASSKAVALDQSASKTVIDTTGLIRLSVDSLFSLLKGVKAQPTDECATLRDFHQCIYFTDGRKIRRLHRAVAALTSTGSEQLGSISLSFSAFRETPRVILARTIQPDGTVKEVPASEIYISNIGGGLSDSRVVQWAFPQVGSGSIVELLVQFEETDVLPENISDYVYFTESFPVISAGYELWVPAIWSVISQCSGGVSSSKEKSDDQVIYRWNASPQSAAIYEDDQPSIAEQADWLQYTYKKTWAEEAATYWQKAVVKIDTSQAMRKLFTGLTKGARTQRDTLQALYRFVADSIRYEAISFGEGTTIPREAASTLSNRYGDCKDKSILLISLLRLAGVTGHCALLDTGDKQMFNAKMPDMNQFNHMIVYVPGIATPWLDPTCGDCDFGEVPDRVANRNALILGSDLSDPLIAIPDSPAAHDQLYRRITMVPLSSGGCNITNCLTFSGPTGEILRGNMARPGDPTSVRSFVEGQAGVGITSSARLTDYTAVPRKQPGLTYDFTGRLTAEELFGKDQASAMVELNLYAVSSVITRPDTTGRRLDVEYEHLVKVIDEVTIAPSPQWQLASHVLPWRWETPWFVAACSSSTVSDSVRITMSFELTRRRIPRDSLKQFNDLLDRMNTRLGKQSVEYRRAPDPAKITALEAAIAASPKDMSLYSALAQEYIGKDGGGRGCFGGENRRKARDIAERALQQDSTNEGILILASILAVGEKQYRRAESLLRLFPQVSQMGILVTGMQSQIYAETGRYKEAIAAMERVMTVASDNGIRLSMVRTYCLDGDLEKARKQIETLQLLHADSVQIVAARYYYAVAQKDWKEAERLVSIWPDTSVAVRRSLSVELMNHQSNWLASAETARMLLREEPESEWAMNNLAWSLFKMNTELDTALELINRTILLDGGCKATTRNTRGAILLALGRLDEAEGEFTYSLQDESANAQTSNLYYLGLIASKRDQRDIARKYFEQAIAANGREAELELARQALTSL